MPSRMTITLRDYSTPGELSTAAFSGDTLTAANFDAQALLMANLSGAVQDITLGTVKKVTRIALETVSAGALPASPFAQREVKWLVMYHDANTGAKQSLEIPTADLQFLQPGSSDEADLTATEMAAFVTAFEAYVKSAAGNAVVIDKVRFVGRRT